MLKMRISFRVMIWQPFAFYILPFSVNPSKLPFHHLTCKSLILKLTSSFFFFMKIRTTLQLFYEPTKEKAGKVRAVRLKSASVGAVTTAGKQSTAGRNNSLRAAQ